jgi:uncharacterized protein YggE
MKRLRFLLFLLFSLPAGLFAQQNPDVKISADTLIVQVEGRYESDPDLAILTFDVGTQEKELRAAYAKASESMNHIVDVAGKNSLPKDAIKTGALTVVPVYENYAKQKVRGYHVKGEVVLRVRDFSKIGSLIDDSIQEGIVDFRSLTYGLSDEESAKKKAVADAMQRAQGRAATALEQNRQKLGPVRFVNLEVTDIGGMAKMIQTFEVEATDKASSDSWFSKHKVPPPAPPPPPTENPEKITVKATIQAVFQIEK